MSKIKQEKLNGYTNEQLIQLIDELQTTSKKKNDLIYQLRIKLGAAKSKVRMMKGRVDFQRKRILELYQ